jgi:hypothetical protein
MYIGSLVGTVTVVDKIINASPDFDTVSDRFVELYMVFPTNPPINMTNPIIPLHENR